MSFNEVVNRKNTGSVKWDMMDEFQKPKDVLPLWVADMDFKAPEGVLKALMDRVDHGVLGYTQPTDSYYEAVVNWMMYRHNWRIKKDWIIITPGIVPALNFVVQIFTKAGEGVLVQRPVYNPFMEAVVNNGRKLVNSTLVFNKDRYEIDFEDVEKRIVENNVKLFILCSPHNPVGRVWTREELITLGDICLKHDVLVVVDEIHHDLVFKSNKHIPFASLGEKYSNNCITCTAPSKTFNIAGLQLSNLIIENKEILQKLNSYLESMALTMSNIFGIIASEAAYNTGEEWLEELLDYIEGNKKLVQEFIAEKFPVIKVIDSEATYLLWIDFRGLGMKREELNHFLLQEAKLWVNDGVIYGEEGSGFQRINIACPRSLLEKGLQQLEDALQKHL
ncbi:MAG TPA: MalY/PatB family protein [Patescibacteria group bacterium]|nr:MalY/PatB family protein [Patescibacteria group bacterium]